MSIVGLIVILGFTISLNSHNIKTFSRAIFGADNTYSEYAFLSDYTQQYDVVLADEGSSWMVPAFGGKVIASIHPVYWIDDHEKRRQDMKLFFHHRINFKIKTGIINKYHADFILVNKKRIVNFRLYDDFGDLTYENNTFRLIKIK